ncbi:hypothetical protein Tco_1172746 [Tanacetum coccineum]
MPPKRTSGNCLQKGLLLWLLCPYDMLDVEQLSKLEVAEALANHETLQNSTNGHGDGSHKFWHRTGIRELRLKKMIGQCKYCTRGEIKKLEIDSEPKSKNGNEVVSSLPAFFKLAIMCGRMFHEESDEVEKYVGGLPDMIRGNVMSYQPKAIDVFQKL